MKQTIIPCLCFLLLWQSSTGQFFHKVGIGMSTGYRYNNSSIYLEWCLKRVSLSGEYIQNKYGGIGFSLSADYYYPMKNNALMPFVGLAYTHLDGGTISLDWGKSSNTNFYVPGASYWIPTIGLRYNLIGYMDRDTYRRKGLLSILLRIGYRIITAQQPNVSYVSGNSNEDLRNKIQTSVDRGIGISLGFSIGLGKKEIK